MTAKLSRAFYERLGNEIANELVEWFNSVDAVYRADLRELNELNFARFDAKLEQRLGQVESRLETRFEQRVTSLEVKLGQSIADLRTEVQSTLPRELASLRTELIKWSFVFFATAALAVIGLR